MLQKIKADLDTFFIVVLLVVSIPLRFVNLSYSDYIGDEHKSFIQYDSDSSLKEFLLTRRKGPMQFLVSEIPHFITNDFTNELAERIPYAIISVATVILFYKLIDKFTNNKWVSFVAAFLYSVNGFIIGFGRIAQYQNLNLFFSFAAIYFYLDLIKNKHTNTQFLVRTLAGTLMLSISALSHWDVVFAVPIIAVIFIKFLLNKDFTVKYKLVLLISNVLFGCLLLLPFLIPYIEVQKTTPDNLRYLYRRLDVGYFIPDRYRLLIELYNPFITFWILLAGTVGSLFWFKKSYPFIIWFAVNYGIFEIFVRKPGTHIYNFLIPAFILVGFTVVGMVKRLKAMWRYIFVAVMSIIFTFFVYQSYMIFVDHTIEYPWDEETLLTFVCKDLKDRKGQFTKCGQFLPFHI